MNEQKKTLKREIQTIIEKKMVEFCSTIKKKNPASTVKENH